MSLQGSYDPDNVFAKILRGEMPAAVITQTDHAVAIMDAFPQTRGHCLVIPKRPSRNLLEASPKDMGRIFGLVQRIAKGVDAALSPDGIIVTQFNGAPAGQTVFHTHVHIIPRYDGSAMAGHGQAGMADMTELTALAADIRKSLDGPLETRK
jgi:histidine triad (HIT) family protein